MDEDIKNWVLLAISKSTKRTGTNVLGLFSKEKPDFFNFDYTRYMNFIKELEKECYIELAKSSFSNLHYVLSKKGEKEIRDLARNDKQKYLYLLRYFPELELKWRVKNIELFIFGVGLLLASYFTIMNKYVKNPNGIIFLLFLLLTSFVISGTYFMTITGLVFETFQITLFNWITDFIEDNKRWLGYGFVILLTLMSSYLVQLY